MNSKLARQDVDAFSLLRTFERDSSRATKQPVQGSSCRCQSASRRGPTLAQLVSALETVGGVPAGPGAVRPSPTATIFPASAVSTLQSRAQHKQPSESTLLLGAPFSRRRACATAGPRRPATVAANAVLQKQFVTVADKYFNVSVRGRGVSQRSRGFVMGRGLTAACVLPVPVEPRRQSRQTIRRVVPGSSVLRAGALRGVERVLAGAAQACGFCKTSRVLRVQAR